MIFYAADFANLESYPLAWALTPFAPNGSGGAYTIATASLERSALVWTGSSRQGLLYGSSNEQYLDGVVHVWFSLPSLANSVAAGVTARANGANWIEVFYNTASGKLEIQSVTSAGVQLVLEVTPSVPVVIGQMYRLEVTMAGQFVSAALFDTKLGLSTAFLTAEVPVIHQLGLWGLLAGGSSGATVEFYQAHLAELVTDGTNLWNELGEEYQHDDEVLKLIFAMVQSPLLRAEVALLRLKDFSDPAKTPNAALPWLLKKIGWYTDEILTPYAARRILNRIPDWRKRYGRAGVIEEIVKEYFWLDPTWTPLEVLVSVRGETDGGFRIGMGRIGRRSFWEHFSRNVLRVTVTTAGSQSYTIDTHNRLYKLLRNLLPAWCVFEVIGV